jgi:hypothetical protein
MRTSGEIYLEVVRRRWLSDTRAKRRLPLDRSSGPTNLSWAQIAGASSLFALPPEASAVEWEMEVNFQK